MTATGNATVTVSVASSTSGALGNEHPPIVVFPRVNAAHAGHPAWNQHIATLRDAGVHLIYGEDVWPLHRPRSAPGRQLPWRAIREAVEYVVKR